MATIEHRASAKAGSNVKAPTFISVVVPMFNEERYVRRCAESLLAQDYPRDRFEILMVDNNSTDRSAEIAREIDGVRVLAEPVQGDYAARNTGIANARGEIIAFTDSDTAPAPDWLTNIAEMMDGDPAIQVIVGRLAFSGSGRLLSLLEAYERDKTAYILSSDDPRLFYGYTCNLAARRSTFDEVGPFAAVARNADVVFVRKVVDAVSTDAVVYGPGVAVQRLEVSSASDYFGKQAVYGQDFPRYGALANARPLTMSERWSIFRRVTRRQRYPALDVVLLLMVLAVGAACYDFGRLLSKNKAP